MLQLLKALFGQKYLNKIIGTRTNVAKPIKMDKASPFRQYSDEAFEDPKTIDYIEKKINEYGPYALSNKNPQEIANFEANAKRLLQAKMRQTGTTQGMVDSMKPRPEAEIIDIGTGKKIDDEGIMTLKERAPQIDTKASANLEEDLAKLTDQGAREYSANIESFRRPIIRQLLLKDTKLKLPDNVRKSLENKMDLDKGADPKMDPLRLLDEYYDWNVNKLDELEDIRFTARDEFEAADEFLKKGGLEPKKDLGDRLKDLPDDIDPDALANGGRPGFAYGTIAKTLLTFLMDTLVKKKKFDPGLLKRVSEQKNGEKLIQELYEKEIGKVPLTTADKAPIPESTITRDMFKEADDRFNTNIKDRKSKQLTKDELEDFENEIGDALEAYDFDGTAADAERILKEQKDYMGKMYTEYKAGKLNPDESLAKALDEIGGGTGDLKYDADVLADELAFQRGLIPEGGDITDIADQMKRMDLYDEAYSALSQQFLKNREIKKMQQFSEPTQTLKSIKEKGTMDISDPTIADEFDKFLRENDPEGYKNLEQKIQLDNFDPKDRKLNASGGLNYLMGL